MEKAEELARSAMVQSDDSKQLASKYESEMATGMAREAELAARLRALEDELQASRTRFDELKHEVAEREEDLRRKRAMERQVSVGSGATASGGDSLRLEAMQQSLRCPVYQNLWKDCVCVVVVLFGAVGADALP